MIKKWFEIITDHKIGLRERMFRIVTSICMIALIFTLPMGRSILNIVLLIVGLTAMALIVRYSIRMRRIQAGATAITVLLLLLFPITFFSAGGFYSGVPEWFVLCFIYVCITLQGRRRAVFFRTLYGGDAALLRHRLLLSGPCRAEYAARRAV